LENLEGRETAKQDYKTVNETETSDTTTEAEDIDEGLATKTGEVEKPT